MGQSNLTARSVKAVNQDEPVAAPLSNHWAVEYHFNSDAFSVRPLPDYLTHAQKAARDGTLFDSVILALHPTRQDARVECTAWQAKRDARPLTVQERLADLQFCQSDLSGHELESRGRTVHVEFWALEYHFFRDDFFLRPFPDYLRLAQANWEKRQLFGSVIVAIRQTELDASEEGKSWQAIRDKRKVSVEDRKMKVQPYIDGLESLCGE